MRGRRLKLTIAGIGALLLAALAAPQASAASQEPIECQFVTSLPATILEPGHYCLDRDLTWDEPGTALSVASSDVQLDLLGHRLVATRAGDPTVTGISAVGDRIEIRGGVIEGFFWGATIHGEQAVLQDLEVVRSGYVGLIARGDGAQIRRNRVIDTGGSSAYPESCPQCTIPLGISGGGRDLVIADNVVAGITPVLEAVGIATTDTPGGRVVGNVISNEALVPATWATWFAASTPSDVQASGNWISGFENGLTFSHTDGAYDGNTFFNVTNRIVCGCPDPLSVLDQGGNRVATGTEPLPVIEPIRTAATHADVRAEIELRLSAPVPWRVDVDWQTRDASALAGVDYAAAAGQITFFPGERSRLGRVPLLPNPARSEQADFQIELSNPSGALAEGPGTVTLFAAGCGAAPAASLNFPAAGGSQGLRTDEMCPTSAIATEPWIDLTLPGTVAATVTVASNALDAARVGWVLLPASQVPVTQAGLGVPAPPALMGPQGAIQRIEPRLEWAASERAQDYVLEIRDSTGQLIWHAAVEAAASCGGSEGESTVCGLTASLPLPVDHDRQPVAWRVRARNAAGLGEWSPAKLVSFSEPAPLAPVSTITGPSPIFRWNALEDGLEYRLWLQDSTATVLVDAWFGAEHCNASVCELPSPLVLTPGAYSWWVQARAGASTTLWNEQADFQVAIPTLAIDDATVTEGNAGTSNATFTVSLAPAVGGTVTVAYATADGTATSGSDYGSTSGTLTFTPGQTSQTVSVVVNGDMSLEADETFFVNLTSPTGVASIGDAQGVGTITNDDALTCPSSAPTGGTIAVQVRGGSSATDWLAVYPDSSAAPSAFLSWGYVPLPRPQTVNMTAPLTPGIYNIRLWPNNTATSLLGSCNVLVAAPPTLAVTDVTVAEGNAGTGNATFTVSLAPAASGTVTVAYATANGTGAAGSDYLSTSGTLTFTAGQTSQTISVVVNGDSTPEANETFFVNLTSPTEGALLGRPQAVGTITNDDAPMTCPASAVPGGTIAVQVFGGTSATDWLALYPNSSVAPSAFLSWAYAPLPRPQTVNMTAPSNPGTYNVRLWPNNTATALLGTCNVVVAAAPTLTINGMTMAEGNAGTSSATFTVTLIPATGGTVTVAYATADGAATAGGDYVSTSGMLTFTSGQTSQTVSVVVNGDSTPEANETFFVNLTAATGGAGIGDAQGVGIITNDDASMTCPASAVPGGTIAVQVFGGSSATDWLAVYPNSGAAPSAYLSWVHVPMPRPRTVNLAAPSTPGTYNIRLWPNNMASALLGSCDVVVAPIPTLSITDMMAAEGNAGTHNTTFTVNLTPAAGGTVTVAYATADGAATAGSDYASASGTLTFTAGQTSQTLSVVVNGDTSPEANETFLVNLTSPTGGALIGDAQGLGTITNDDGPMVCPSSAVPGGTIAVQVFEGSSATDWLALYPDSGAAPSAYLSWVHVPLPRPQIMNMTAPSAPGAYNIRLWPNNTAAALLGSCDVVVAPAPTLTLNDVIVAEGNAGTSNATFTVSLTPAAGGTVTVAYATANGTGTAGSDYVSTSGTLTFTAGQTSQTVTLVVNGDATPEATETFFVNLSSPTGGSLLGDPQGVGTIANDDAPMTCPASATPGGTIAVQVFDGSSPTDWLGVYTNSGAAPSAYLSWVHVPLPRPQTVNMTAPSTPGAYDIRLWPNNTATVLLGACTVVVTASGSPP